MTATNTTEATVRTASEAGLHEQALTATIRIYGNEFYAFIAARMRNPADAQDAFSLFVEALWLSLPKFSWRCSMRTWGYTLARHAVSRYASSQRNHADRCVPLSAPALSQLIAHVQTTTAAFRKTETKDRFRELRERLDPEEQELLILRVDRGLSFRELAITTLGDADRDDATVVREAARLRKAFERATHTLRGMAEAEGLLAQDKH